MSAILQTTKKMNKQSLQSRIAFSYIVSTALLTGVLCAVILAVFKINTARYNDEIIKANAAYYTERASLENGLLVYRNKTGEEIKTGERDKRTTYIEIISKSGNLVYATPNLNGNRLPYGESSVVINNEKVRLTRSPLQLGDQTEGTILIGVTVGDAETLMTVLFRVCAVGYLILLVVLFLIARIIARNSIKPIREIITISNTITHNNLSARIPLPNHKDELYELSDTINKLLDRIESAMEREKSFASYASHEFRTPLSVLKGTMEVLIRRPRSDAEYKERIGACIKEVDQLNDMVEQLLLLTRYEDGKRSLNYDYYLLEDLIANGIGLVCDLILTRKLRVKTSVTPQNVFVYTDEYLLSTILNNLISNAAKYSNNEGFVEIEARQNDDYLIVKIRNSGQGIPPEELEQIFEKFYRSYSSERPEIKGFGLGLPIVKRFCSLLNIDIEIVSETNQLTEAKLTIPLGTETFSS